MGFLNYSVGGIHAFWFLAAFWYGWFDDLGWECDEFSHKFKIKHIFCNKNKFSLKLSNYSPANGPYSSCAEEPITCLLVIQLQK